MKSIWRNNIKKQYYGLVFTGHYRFVDGDREFVLKRIANKKQVSYESWQAAKYDGWVRSTKSKGGYVL